MACQHYETYLREERVFCRAAPLGTPEDCY